MCRLIKGLRFIKTNPLQHSFHLKRSLLFHFLFNLLGFTFTPRNVFLFLAAKIARISRMNCELTNPMMLCGFPFGSLCYLAILNAVVADIITMASSQKIKFSLFSITKLGKNWNLLDRFMRAKDWVEHNDEWDSLLSSRWCFFYKKCIELSFPIIWQILAARLNGLECHRNFAEREKATPKRNKAAEFFLIEK